MKKLTMITAVFVSLTSFSIAQENIGGTDNREKMEFGLKAGVNYSNVYDAQGEKFNADPKLGFAGGAFVEIPIGKYFGVQPEVLISQKGFKASGLILGDMYYFTRTTTYIDIPLQFAFKPSEFITIVAGPQYSYLINQRDVFANATTSIAQEQQFQNENLRKNIFGVVGGLDINLRHVTIGARVGWDVQNNRGDGTVATPRYKNAWYQVTVGFKLYK